MRWEAAGEAAPGAFDGMLPLVAFGRPWSWHLPAESIFLEVFGQVSGNADQLSVHCSLGSMIECGSICI
jgi:hypothetical protein